MLDYEKWERLNIKKSLKGKDALEAVKRKGHALRYVSEQIINKRNSILEMDGKKYEVKISKEIK